MDDNAAHIGTDDKATAWWRWFARRAVLLPLVAILLVGLCAWVFLQIKHNSDKKSDSLNAAIKASDAAFQTGDYNKQLDSLKSATDDAKTKAQKVDLYSNLAAAAANAGKMDEAVSYLEKKHEIDPSTTKEDAYLIGSYYESISQNDKALQQYKLALQYKQSLPKSNRNDADIQSIKARIESLQGGQ